MCGCKKGLCRFDRAKKALNACTISSRKPKYCEVVQNVCNLLPIGSLSLLCKVSCWHRSALKRAVFAGLNTYGTSGTGG